MSAVSISAHSRPEPSRWAATRKTLAAIGKRAADATAATQSRLWSLRQAALGIGGLACIDGSAYQVNTGTGLLVTGASLLLLGWLGEDDD